MATINLTIIGLKRLGTSVGLALKRYMKAPGAEHQFVITGNDESSDAIRAARKLEAIDQVARSPAVAVAKADLVVLAARYSLYDDLVDAISASLKPGAVIIDLSPLKQRAVERGKKSLPRDEQGDYTAYLVGATAILNPALINDADDSTESARADLFDKGTMVLSPAADCRGEAIQLVSDFSVLLGMSVHFTDPAEHDGLVASMEALPLLANLGLFRAVSQQKAWDDLQRLGTPPFLLATAGLGLLGPEDAAATINGNRERTLQALEILIGTLDEVHDMLMDDDELLIAEAFATAMDKRDAWLLARRKNDWGERNEIKPTMNVTLLSTLATRFSFRGLRPGDHKSDDKNGKK